MGASTRDLDDWADALSVNNDDDAQAAMARLLAKALFVSRTAHLLERSLADLPVGQDAKLAGRYIDEAGMCLVYAADGFKRHERGMH
jgi:hypothetical protein